MLIKKDNNVTKNREKVLLKQGKPCNLNIKKLQFENMKLSDIESETNPNNFWKILKSMNPNIKTHDDPLISSQEWLNHFEKLHEDIPLLSILMNFTQLFRIWKN